MNIPRGAEKYVFAYPLSGFSRDMEESLKADINELNDATVALFAVGGFMYFNNSMKKLLAVRALTVRNEDSDAARNEGFHFTASVRLPEGQTEESVLALLDEDPRNPRLQVHPNEECKRCLFRSAVS